MDGPPSPQSIVDEGIGALAWDLAHAAADRRATTGGLVYVDATGERLAALAGAAACFAPGLDLLTLPAWDTLPYDRASPSAQVTGRRVATLKRLAAPHAAPRLLLTSARGLLQRVPDAGGLGADRTIAAGDALDRAALEDWLTQAGYVADETVDRPGEYALRGNTIDLFQGHAAAPVRLLAEDDRVTGIRAFDAATQRSGEPLDAVTLHPVREHGPADVNGLVCALDLLPDAAIVLHAEAEERWQDWDAQVADAHGAFVRAVRSGGEAAGLIPPPGALFVPLDALRVILDGRRVTRLAARTTPAAPEPRTLPELVAALRGGGVLAVGGQVAGADAARMAKLLTRRGVAALAVDTLAAAPPDGVACIALAIDQGFSRGGVRYVPLPPALRARGVGGAALAAEQAPRVGDLVVHPDHGICRLSGLRAVAAEERVALAFHEGTELLVPTAELDALWRYGTDTGHVALDRLHGDAWRTRAAEIAAEIADTAAKLVAEAAARAVRTAPVIGTDQRLARFSARFPYPTSPDQQAAIDATLADMEAGRPMDRLICGDVGFGKTEVALRAAAAAALAGHQVAVVAPTIVLARQHFDTFARRFAGFGIRVEPLMRGAAAAGAKAVRDGLADGGIGIVVGTHALASEKIRFKNLALVVVDEEQRFGDAQKAKLAALRNPSGGVHSLVMSATPIPRTLQTAMVGLRQVSVIATAPVSRRATRTFVLPAEDAVIAESLLRERRRGGQSFVVAPRIEALPALADRLRRLVPGLTVTVAHGRLKPAALEAAVAGFAGGEGDVLLATNIIEAGLDIPGANTILIIRPDRFGLSQLHQMRGRVGRGGQRGFAYLLTDPARPLPTVTARRLSVMETQAQLGAGLAISAADLDARGAGDLFGSTQAGHVHAIGTELYQHLLAGTLASLRGAPTPPPAPDLRTEVGGRIPDEYVPEPDVRLDLYRRMLHAPDTAALDALADELVDRFGPVPEALAPLLALGRLRLWCRDHAVVRLDAGPAGIALTPADPARAAALIAAIPGAAAKADRVILPLAIPDPHARLTRLLDVLMAAPPLSEGGSRA